MKKFLLFFLGVVFLSTLIFITPSVIGAKEKKPYIFIHYDGKVAKPGACSLSTNDQVNIFIAHPWKLRSGITDYKLNYSTKPKTLSDESFRSAVDSSFSTVQDAGGGQLFRNVGSSGEIKASNDNQNTLMFSALPAGIVAMTYVWADNGRLIDVDTVFNKKYTWSYTGYNGSNDCGGQKTSFDLRNIATHEFGHWVGLGDLYDQRAKDLTMYGFTVRGELKKDTLGLGDITGVRALWP